MTNHQLVNQDSSNTEIYTPPAIIEAARMALGGVIELDPASSAKANETVKAKRYFTKDDDGLSKDWECETLWMNHPFSRAGNTAWIEKLVLHWWIGLIKTGACCITYASTSEEWFRPLLAYPQCYLWPRTNYLKPDGSIYRGVTKGSVVTYLGVDVDLFRSAFKNLGTVKI